MTREEGTQPRGRWLGCTGAAGLLPRKLLGQCHTQQMMKGTARGRRSTSLILDLAHHGPSVCLWASLQLPLLLLPRPTWARPRHPRVPGPTASSPRLQLQAPCPSPWPGSFPHVTHTQASGAASSWKPAGMLHKPGTCASSALPQSCHHVLSRLSRQPPRARPTRVSPGHRSVLRKHLVSERVRAGRAWSPQWQAPPHTHCLSHFLT